MQNEYFVKIFKTGSIKLPCLFKKHFNLLWNVTDCKGSVCDIRIKHNMKIIFFQNGSCCSAFVFNCPIQIFLWLLQGVSGCFFVNHTHKTWHKTFRMRFIVENRLMYIHEVSDIPTEINHYSYIHAFLKTNQLQKSGSLIKMSKV